MAKITDGGLSIFVTSKPTHPWRPIESVTVSPDKDATLQPYRVRATVGIRVVAKSREDALARAKTLLPKKDAFVREVECAEAEEL